ncbi:type IV secretory system conjugative DNA transfer family protein [Gilvimarinus chinensis]|uniref:type IV secretory system conjugative DNA transfer family protein n=1 Tax=Gilvimarinus chinensis TaxID=396005 RepID=UPI00036B1B69|nr:type IV secretory system conjugative DNA transfer family protein [Gilvimarinus chinensis]
MDKDSPKAQVIFAVAMIFAALACFVLITVFSFLHLTGLPTDSNPMIALDYWNAYGSYKEVQQKAAMAAGIGGAMVVLFGAIFLKPNKLSLYGDAKWAKEADLQKADPCLRGKKGILLGRFKGKYIIQEGQQFALMGAPTRSMKGVGIVIPNCLNWHDSLVVTDTKLENYEITSGYRREMGQEVYLFNPSPKDYKTHRWNALAYISDDINFRIDDIQKISEFLMPTPKGADPMWTSEARKLFLGIVLYLIDTPGFPVTLGEVYRQLHTEMSLSDYFEEILESRSDDLDPNCQMALSKFANMPSKQREGVVSTLAGSLNLWANPLLDAATSENDFDLRDLRRRRMTVYVGITPDNLERMAPVINLFFQQLVDLNTRELPQKGVDKHSVLLLMDEFPAFGKMPTISKGVSYMAGYNLRLLPIIQSPEQLREIYGPEVAENFVKNHATRIIYAPKTSKDAEEISNELGFITTKSESISKPRELGKGMGSKNESQAKRHLLLPQEVKEIGKSSEIIISENCRPVMAKKIIYFQDDNFLKRCVPAENLKAAKACKDQETFRTLVKPAAEIPSITASAHEMRGLKPREYDLDFDSVELPEEQRTLTDEEIDNTVDEFFALINN